MATSLEESIREYPQGAITLDWDDNIEYDIPQTFLGQMRDIFNTYLYVPRVIRYMKSRPIENLPIKGMAKYMEVDNSLDLYFLTTSPSANGAAATLLSEIEYVALIKGSQYLTTTTHVSEKIMNRLGWARAGKFGKLGKYVKFL